MPTKIEWTDEVWNPATGCTKVASGCANCYAEGVAKRFWKDRPFSEVRCHEDRLDQPLKWKKPRKVFVCSMGDLFHENVPIDFVADVFGVMAVAGAARPETTSGGFRGPGGARYGPHQFQILTKRPKRAAELLVSAAFRTKVASAAFRWAHNRTDAGYLSHQIGTRNEYSRCYEPGRMWPLSNIWLGCSASTQKELDESLPYLLDTPAAVRFVSLEPLIEGIDLAYPKTLWPNGPEMCCAGHDCACQGRPVEPPLWMIHGQHRLDWVIVGGESGPGARSCGDHWIDDIVQQYSEAKVPCYVKQLGSNAIGGGGFPMRLNDSKGGDPSEWPEDLRVRQYP